MRTKVGILVFCAIGVILGSRPSWAGNTVGNGGDALVCYSEPGHTVASVEFYDHFEARIRHGIMLDFGAQNLSVDGKLEIIFKRIERLNPSRSKLYRGWYQAFPSEAEFKSGGSLLPIPDVGYGFIPAGCEIKQLAVQMEPKFPTDNRYQIDRSWYERLDADNQAMFILHELILRELRSQGTLLSDSSSARYYNAMLGSHLTDSYSEKDYFGLLKLVGLDRADAAGIVPVLINAKEPTFYPNGRVEMALPESGVSGIYNWRGNSFPVIFESFPMYFTPQGEIVGSIYFSDSDSDTHGFSYLGQSFSSIRTTASNGEIYRRMLTFNKQGDLSRVDGGLVVSSPGSGGPLPEACADAEFRSSTTPAFWCGTWKWPRKASVLIQGQLVELLQDFDVMWWRPCTTGRRLFDVRSLDYSGMQGAFYYMNGSLRTACTRGAVNIFTAKSVLSAWQVSFFDTGTVRAAILAEDIELPTVQMPTGEKFKSSEVVEFDESGTVIASCRLKPGQQSRDCNIVF